MNDELEDLSELRAFRLADEFAAKCAQYLPSGWQRGQEYFNDFVTTLAYFDLQRILRRMQNANETRQARAWSHSIFQFKIAGLHDYAYFANPVVEAMIKWELQRALLAVAEATDDEKELMNCTGLLAVRGLRYERLYNCRKIMPDVEPGTENLF